MRKLQKTRKPRTSSRDVNAQVRSATGRVDRLLSQAQDIIGRELQGAEFKAQAPRTHRAADKTYDLIERARWALMKRA